MDYSTAREVIRRTLQEFFTAHPRAAVAFSGGVDSAYLLYAARECGCDVRAYFVKSVFQPAFELQDARRLCGELSTPLTVVEADILSIPGAADNGPDRCYHCKKALFTLLRRAAEADGYPLLLDGTNASDDADDRPGMQALRELEVRSPLRECGLSKAEIRRKSRAAGLFTWDKPSYACLATRVPTGVPIRAEDLTRVEAAENALFTLGFSDFRVRLTGEVARLQVPSGQLSAVLEQRGKILESLSPLFPAVLLDLEARADSMEVLDGQ